MATFNRESNCNLVNNFLKIVKDPHFYVPILLSIGLILAGNIFQSGIQNMMKVNLLGIGRIEIDFWSITHILLYMYFGYYFPDYFTEFLIIGAVWELIESSLCRESLFQFLNGDICLNNTEKIYCQILNQIKSCDYWYGKLDDLVMNMVGFVIGTMLVQKN